MMSFAARTGFGGLFDEFGALGVELGSLDG
jgi:hypothetical protein